MGCGAVFCPRVPVNLGRFRGKGGSIMAGPGGEMGEKGPYCGEIWRRKRGIGPLLNGSVLCYPIHNGAGPQTAARKVEGEDIQ